MKETSYTTDKNNSLTYLLIVHFITMLYFEYEYNPNSSSSNNNNNNNNNKDVIREFSFNVVSKET